MTFAGAVVLALGVVGWAFAEAPWQLYVAALLSGAGWPALGVTAISAIVAPWFLAGRPAALSIAYNGASIGGVIFSPLWVALIGRIGFRLPCFSRDGRSRDGTHARGAQPPCARADP